MPVLRTEGDNIADIAGIVCERQWHTLGTRHEVLATFLLTPFFSDRNGGFSEPLLHLAGTVGPGSNEFYIEGCQWEWGFASRQGIHL